MGKSILSARMTDLLNKAATCFEDGRSPFENDWLSKNNVTLDECIDLSRLIGSILSGFSISSFTTQREIFVNGALSGLKSLS